MKQMVTICDYCSLLGMHPTKIIWSSQGFYITTQDAVSHMRKPKSDFEFEYCDQCKKDYCNSTVKCRLLHRSEHLSKESK